MSAPKLVTRLEYQPCQLEIVAELFAWVDAMIDKAAPSPADTTITCSSITAAMFSAAQTSSGFPVVSSRP